MDLRNFLSNDKFLDFHTHRLRHKDRRDIIEIVSIHPGKDREKELFTVGKHPWWADAPINKSEREELISILTHDYCIAMGEMGLDKLKGVSISEQMAILKSQLEIAQELNLPVIIHCVRAYDQIQQIKKQYPKIKKWCIHGFSRHLILAKQLIDQGFYLSVMPRYRDQEIYSQLMKHLPAEKFFLETDSMPNVSIEEIYLQVSDIRGMSVSALKEQMINNALIFFENE